MSDECNLDNETQIPFTIASDLGLNKDTSGDVGFSTAAIHLSSLSTITSQPISMVTMVKVSKTEWLIKETDLF
jgi:hypothetical protein